jgi:hypothetical protein
VVLESGINRRVHRDGFIIIRAESIASKIVMVIRVFAIGQGIVLLIGLTIDRSLLNNEVHDVPQLP